MVVISVSLLFVGLESTMLACTVALWVTLPVSLTESEKLILAMPPEAIVPRSQLILDDVEEQLPWLGLALRKVSPEGIV